MKLSKLRIVSTLIIIGYVALVAIIGYIAYDYGKFWEIFPAVWGWLNSILMFVYIKSPKAYLFFHKWVLRPFVDRWSIWQFSGYLRVINRIDTHEFLAKLKKSLGEEFVIIKESDVLLKINYHDGLIVFRIRVEDNEVNIFTNSFSVPDTEYENLWDILFKVIDSLEKILKPEEKSYNLVLEYKENPYYKFFLKQIPFDFIEKFSLIIRIPTVHSKYRVIVTKTKVDITSSNASYLKEGVFKALELSEL